MTLAFIILLVVFALFQIGDATSTYIFLRNNIREANPILRWCIDHLGHGWIVVKLGLAAGIGYILWRIGPQAASIAVLVGINAAYAYAIWRNTAAIRRRR